MIIGISGKFCSGKDLVADYLIKRWSFRKVGFATKLKSVCADLFGMVGKDRSLLQQVGAAMRGIDDLVWVHYALKQNCADERIVVSDVRYRNEAETYSRLVENLSGLSAPRTNGCGGTKNSMGIRPHERRLNISVKQTSIRLKSGTTRFTPPLKQRDLFSNTSRT